MTILNSVEAAKVMTEITGVIKPDVFSIGGVGLLIIHATGDANAANACAKVSYESLDEVETLEWMGEIDHD